MFNEPQGAVNWIEQCIQSAKEAAPVPDGLIAPLTAMMRGHLTEQMLSAGELSRFAKELLAKLDGTPSDADR